MIIRSPKLWRCLIYAAGWMAPVGARTEWRHRWQFRLENLCILIERGEVPAHLSGHASLLCRDALTNAFRLRFAPTGWRSWPRAASFVVVCAALIAGLTALLTRGFAATRSLIDAASSWAMYYTLPPLPKLAHTPYDPRASRVVGHLVPLMLALAASIVLLLIGRLSIRRYGWRYWSFLAAKTVVAMAIVPALWIETGAALRARIPNPALSVAIGGVGLSLIFIAVFGTAIVWVFSDQRLRCPVCLRRLHMPVTIGSWGSTFEPPATELLCDAGHGSLCVFESTIGEPDRWVALDDSWRVAPQRPTH